MKTICPSTYGRLEKKGMDPSVASSFELGEDDAPFRKGSLTSIYTVTNPISGTKPYALKWLHLSDGNHEIKKQTLAASHGLALPVLETWTCVTPFDTKTGFVMEQGNHTLREVLSSISSEQLREAKQYLSVDLGKIKDLVTEKRYLRIKEDLLWSNTFQEIQHVYQKITSSYLKYTEMTLPYRDPLVLIDDTVTKHRKKQALHEVRTLIQRLHDIGIKHGDAHLSNFMSVEPDGRYVAIDLADASNMDEMDDESPTDEEIFQNSLSDFINESMTGRIVHHVLYLLHDARLGKKERSRVKQRSKQRYRQLRKGL